MGSLEVSDAESAAVQKTPNRVTLESMQDRIGVVEYYHPDVRPTMTIAVVKVNNGFILVGKSAPADPANFNEELGRRLAFEDALRQMWPLEGYLLCEKLSSEGY